MTLGDKGTSNDFLTANLFDPLVILGRYQVTRLIMVNIWVNTHRINKQQENIDSYEDRKISLDNKFIPYKAGKRSTIRLVQSRSVLPDRNDFNVYAR